MACAACRGPWAVDLRHAQAACPRCAAPADLSLRRRLWEGERPQDAQAAAAALRLAKDPAAAQAVQALARPAARALPRHDTPADAAAAQGTGIRNLSQRAEAVALALARLQGLATHGGLVAALGKAGIPPGRAEAEVARMLACDVLLEPQPGRYRPVG